MTRFYCTLQQSVSKYFVGDSQNDNYLFANEVLVGGGGGVEISIPCTHI